LKKIFQILTFINTKKVNNIIKKEISIVIPAYNEENRIGKTLEIIINYCKKNFKDYEIIVVDDCSKDSTNNLVLSYKNKKIKLLKNLKNRGKGYCVKIGVLNAKFPLILFSDSDLATPIEEVKKMISYIENGFDFVIASRNLKDSKIFVKQPKYRQNIGKLFALFVNILTGIIFKDTQCGFKLFKKYPAKFCFKKTTIERFTFDVELLYIAKKHEFKIKEVPVTWIDKPGSKVKVLRDSYRMLKDLFKIRLNDWVLRKY